MFFLYCDATAENIVHDIPGLADNHNKSDFNVRAVFHWKQNTTIS